MILIKIQTFGGKMTQRFKEIISTQKIIDTETNIEYYGLIDNELLKLFNEREEYIKELAEDLTKTMKFIGKQKSESIVEVDFDEFIQMCKDVNTLRDKEEQIRELKFKLTKCKKNLDEYINRLDKNEL